MASASEDVTCRKRRDRTVREKSEILKLYDGLPKMSQPAAAVALGVPQPTLCRILRSRDAIQSEFSSNTNVYSKKRKRTGKDADVETALKDWFSLARAKNAPLSGPLLREKANDLARKMGKNFQATEGWFNRWKARENIVYRKACGEQRDADVKGADVWLKEEWPRLAARYAPDDVYNADETALYYRAMPETTFMFKDENAKGCKIAKDRITVLTCVSLTGEKEKLMVIGKSKAPRCFKNVSTLPVDYRANKTAWMTALLFIDFLKQWDRRLRRNILLLIDNCPAHKFDCGLKHIEIALLPANTTSLIQPCDQGVIKTLKSHYRTELRRKIIQELDSDLTKFSAHELCRKIDLLSAVHLLAQAWKRVTPVCIRNCFQKGGFSLIPPDDVDSIVGTDDFEIPDDLTADAFQEWLAIDEHEPTTAAVSEDDICSRIMEEKRQTVTEEESDDEDEVGTTVQFPASKEIQSALTVLRQVVQCRGGEEDFDSHFQYEKMINSMLKCKQTEITDYFL